MDADRIHILHAADGDGLICAVTHYLKLYLLVSLYGFLDQHLMHRRKIECLDADIFEFLFIVGKSAARSAERERRSQDYRISYVQSCLLCLFDAVCDLARDDRLAYGLAHLLEELSVLGSFDGIRRSSEKLYPALSQNALFVQLHGEVESRLSADTRDDGIRSLISQDLCDIFQSKRLHVYLVCYRCVRHDSSRIRVAEYYLIALFLQRQTRLSARVVKLRRLSDNDRS